jgi:hypothetical protein
MHDQATPDAAGNPVRAEQARGDRIVVEDIGRTDEVETFGQDG